MFVCRFLVVVSPLNAVNTFSSSYDLNDFVWSPGYSGNGVSVNAAAGQLELSYSGFSWQNASTGRGFSPYLVRRVPDGASFEVGTIDCGTPPTDATFYSCGLVIFNAGANTPLLTWTVGRSTITGRSVAGGGGCARLAWDVVPSPTLLAEWLLRLLNGFCSHTAPLLPLCARAKCYR